MLASPVAHPRFGSGNLCFTGYRGPPLPSLRAFLQSVRPFNIVSARATAVQQPVCCVAFHQRSSSSTSSSSSSSTSSSSRRGSLVQPPDVGNQLRWASRLAQPTRCQDTSTRDVAAHAYSAYGTTGDSPQQTLLQRLAPGWLLRNWPIIQRLLVTLAMLVVIRLGYFIPVPGVDLTALPAAATSMEGERMMRALYGQAQALPASLFELGISPHINASIIVTVLLMLSKDLLPFSWANRLRDARKEGKAGEALINDRINYLALLFALYAAVHKALELAPYALYSQGFVLQTALALVAGSFMIHQCANTVTAAGVGNGSTLVICMGIITEYSSTLHQVFAGLESSVLPLWQLGGLLLGYLGLLLFTVYLASSEVRLPIVQYSKVPPPDPPQPGQNSTGGRSELLASARALLDKKASAAGNTGAFFPLLLNSSGVMPMIIASAAFYGILPKAAEFVGLIGVANFIYGLQATAWGLLVYGLLVFAMEFLPFGAVNPPEVAEYFTMIDVGIKGVAPGYNTQQFLTQKMRQCKFWGGLALAGLAVTANLFDQLCMSIVGTTLATTSLVIIVGAVLQTSRQVESLLEGPRLQHKLDNERRVIQSLSM